MSGILFQKTDCDYFPCHKNIDPEKFDCTFCYCPLYNKGEECGGNYKFCKDRIKDCSDCVYPHLTENREEILKRIGKQ